MRWTKGIRVADIGPARERLRAAGIRACYFLQFGYPGETWKEIEDHFGMVRATRPDEMGISLSYPLPGTVFYERVHRELGAKRNWTDSDDLCVMFTAAYTNEFYLRAARRAPRRGRFLAWSRGRHRRVIGQMRPVEAVCVNWNLVCRNQSRGSATSVFTDAHKLAANFVPLQQLVHCFGGS